MSYRLDVLPDDAWADAVAADLAARLDARPELRLCLPTGETPAPLYESLGRMADRGEISFAKATIVLLDEYLGLPADDPARGGPRLARELVDRVAPARYHAIDADATDPEAAARQHDAIAAEGLDLTLLGLGLNGHIGLNEPGSGAETSTAVVSLASRSQAVAQDYGAATAPASGITLGIARLLESAEIWLLVTGERKAGILARALLGPEGPEIPATFLRRHSNYRVVADRSAAAEIPRG